ncbi:trypco2 family protein [Streptomyces mirabilis]|uniref:trypco2 family protein n=1 Tax=Streptomyces mirabilis TaxID=68239 RepID=UPI0036E588BB
MAHIGLAQVIELLRRELGDAQEAGAHQQLRFEVAEVQVELLVELREEIRPEVKLSFGVVSGGAGAAAGSSHTHRLTLKLNVRDEALGGRKAQVARQKGHAWDAGN